MRSFSRLFFFRFSLRLCCVGHVVMVTFGHVSGPPTNTNNGNGHTILSVALNVKRECRISTKYRQFLCFVVHNERHFSLLLLFFCCIESALVRCLYSRVNLWTTTQNTIFFVFRCFCFYSCRSRQWRITFYFS